MNLKNILTKLCTLILFFSCSSLSYSFTPIPINFRETYSFSLEEPSKFIIFYFQNDMDSTSELFFRFNNRPYYGLTLYLYFSVNDVSDNIESLISCNPYTGQFFGSFYNSFIDDKDIIIEGSEFDDKYLRPGYIYAVISITSTRPNPYYNGELLIYNSKFMPELSISKKFGYFKFISPYLKNYTFFLPTISNDTLIRVEFNSSIYGKLYIYQEKNNTKNLFYKSDYDYCRFGEYFNLSKGFSYYFYIYYSNKQKIENEILFSFPQEEFPKIIEGKSLFIYSLIGEYFYFYYDTEKMKIGDSLYIGITHEIKGELWYKELLYNDYDYIYQRKNMDYSHLIFPRMTNKIGNKSISLFNYNKKTISEAILFIVKSDEKNFTSFHIQIFSSINITEPENIQKNFKQGEIGYFSINLESIQSFKKNMLIYSNEKDSLIIFCNGGLSDYGKYYTNIRLYFIDSSNSNPEESSSNSNKFYGALIYHPYSEEYSIDIKFIDKNIYFTNEIRITFQEQIIRKSIYNNITLNQDEYKLYSYNTIKQNDKVENYSITYQKLYGNIDAEIINLDNIKSKTIDEFLNPDFSFNEKYAVSLSDPSPIGQFMIIHIKINFNRTNLLDYDHIAYYENILKMNNTFSDKLSEGEQIILFPDIGKYTYIYFKPPYEDFNLEIKFLGVAKSKRYNIKIIACEEEEKILDNNNKLYRGKCKNVNKDSKILLINNGSPLSGVIIKRAIPRDKFSIISKSYENEVIIGKDKFYLIKYEKGLKNLIYFYNEIKMYELNYFYCIYQEYSDEDYISYPIKYACRRIVENFISYTKLSVDYNMIYGENSAMINGSDSLYLYINPKYDCLLLFKHILDNKNNTTLTIIICIVSIVIILVVIILIIYCCIKRKKYNKNNIKDIEKDCNELSKNNFIVLEKTVKARLIFSKS